MTGNEGETDPREARDESSRRVARADAALELARSNRDVVAADVADRLNETAAQRARTTHRYAIAQAAFEYAAAVRTTALGEAQALDAASIRADTEPIAPAVEIAYDLSPHGASIDAAEAIGNPVDRLLTLAETARHAADAVRAVDAAISRAVRHALNTMTLDDLSRQLHQASDDNLFLLPPAVWAPPATD